MANIKINELRPAGLTLFSDSESFLELLTEEGLDDIKGGKADINSCVQFLVTSNASEGKGLKSLGATFLAYNAPFAKDSPFSVLNVEKTSINLEKDSKFSQTLVN